MSAAMDELLGIYDPVQFTQFRTMDGSQNASDIKITMILSLSMQNHPDLTLRIWSSCHRCVLEGHTSVRSPFRGRN